MLLPLKESSTTSFWSGVWRGIKGGIKDTFGLDLQNEINRSWAAGVNPVKREDKEAVNELYKSIYANDESQAREQEAKGFSGEAGELAGNSAVFAAPFAVASKPIKVIQTGTKLAMGVGRSATKVGNAARELAAYALGDASVGFLGAATVGAPRTIAGTAKRSRGELQNDGGQLKYKGGDDLAHAFASEFLSNAIEYSSEMAGEHMKEGVKLLKRSKLAKAVGKKVGALSDKFVGKVSEAANASALGSAYRGIKAGLADLAKKSSLNTAGKIAKTGRNITSEYFKRAQIQGLPYEVAEEYLGTAENAMLDTGNGNWSDIVDPEQNKLLWGGIAMSMGLSGAVAATFGLGLKGLGLAGRTIGYHRVKNALDRADSACSSALGERWGEIKSKFDSTPNSSIINELNKQTKSMPAAQAELVTDYALSLMRYRGYNIGTAAEAAGGNGLTEPDNQYEEGYQSDDAEKRRSVKNDYDTKRSGILNKFGEEALAAIDSDPISYLADHKEDMDDDSAREIIEYTNARFKYAGMQQRADDDADMASRAATSEVDARTNKDDGMIHSATLKDGGKVYIVSGNVVMSADGKSVDKGKSSKRIVVRDAQSGEMSMLPADDVTGLDDPIDAQQERDAAAKAAAEQSRTASANVADGLTTHDNPQLGDEVYVRGDDGKPVRGVIRNVDSYTGDYMVETEAPIAGKKAQPFKSEQLYDRVQDEDTDADTVVDTESNAIDTTIPTPDDSRSQPQEQQYSGDGEMRTHAASAPQEPMPMRKDGEEDWQATTPERAHSYIYGGEAGLSRQEGNEFVEAQIAAAKTAFAKAQKAPAPKMGTSIKSYNAAKAKRQGKIDATKAALDYWQQVRSIQDEIQRKEAETDAQRAPQVHAEQAPQTQQPAQPETDEAPQDKATDEQQQASQTPIRQTQQAPVVPEDATTTEQGGEESEGVNSEDSKSTEERHARILVNMGDKYSLSDEHADNGEAFIQNEKESTKLAEIPNEIFDKLGVSPVPFKMTETMGWHVFTHHGKEGKMKSVSDAVDFVLDVINHVDHVRLGRDKSYIFSIENNRSKIGRRAITIVIDGKTGEFMGIRTTGYEPIKKLKERPLLWERGAKSVPEDAASTTITTIEPQQSGEAPSRTKSQSNKSSAANVGNSSESSDKKEENVGEGGHVSHGVEAKGTTEKKQTENPKRELTAEEIAAQIAHLESIKDNRTVDKKLVQAEIDWLKALLGKAEVKKKPNTEKPPKANAGQFGLVSDERMEELKKRLRAKLNNLNMGVDPEVLAIGLELTAGYIDRGVRKFAEYSKVMIKDLGDVVRPYLKAFYNGARDMPEITGNGLDKEMDDYDTVSKFNVATIGKDGEDVHPSIIDTAKQVSNESHVAKEAQKVSDDDVKKEREKSEAQDKQSPSKKQGESEKAGGNQAPNAVQSASAAEARIKAVKDKIAEVEARAKSNDDFSGLNKAKMEMEKLFGELSEEQLDEIAKTIDGGEWEGISVADYDVRDAFDRVYSLIERKRDFIQEKAEASKKIEPKTPQKKVSPMDFSYAEGYVNSNIKRLCDAVYHGGGYVVGTNGKIIYARKEDYPKELEGKTTNKKGEITEVEFPKNWRVAFPSAEDTVPFEVDIDALHRFVAGVRAADKNKSSRVLIKLPNGRMVMYATKDLDLLLRAAKKSASKVMICDSLIKRDMLLFQGDDAAGAMMPYVFEFNDLYDEHAWLYDASRGGEAQAQAKKAEEQPKAEKPKVDAAAQQLPTERSTGHDTKESEAEPEAVGTGDFGPIYDQFKGKPNEAVKFLMSKKDGEAIGALHHKDVGDIDLVWGKEGTGHSDGYGLSKLAKYHPEVLKNLQEILDDMRVVKRTKNRIQLESDTHQATVRLTWNDKKKRVSGFPRWVGGNVKSIVLPV